MNDSGNLPHRPSSEGSMKGPLIGGCFAIIAALLVVYLPLFHDDKDSEILEDKDVKVRSVLVNIDIEDNSENTKRNMYITTTYKLEALKDLSKNQKNFIKTYTKSYAKSVQHISGSHLENVVSSGKNNIKTFSGFDAKKGEIFTAIYRANITFLLPLPESRTIRGAIPFETNEDWWGYPNKHGYNISEVVITVTSRNTPLQFSSIYPYTKVSMSGEISTVGIHPGPSTKIVKNSGLLSARWTELEDSQIAAIRFQW